MNHKQSMLPGLSVVVATHNEAENMSAFLKAIKPIADEVIIVDGESSDDTVKIAKQFGAHVLTVPNQKMFHINKQIGIEKATCEWILQLDADEIITKELGAQIRAVVEGKHQEIDLGLYKSFRAHMANIAARDGVTYHQTPPIQGYFIARKNLFLGRYLMHSGVYPDGVIRLFRNGHGQLPCKSVHEQVEILGGGVSWLSSPMEHMSDPTFRRYLQRANRYTTISAKQYDKQKLSVDPLTFVVFVLIKPSVTFFELFFRHKGFLDGFSGFVWSLMSGLHHAVAYMKYLEMRKK